MWWLEDAQRQLEDCESGVGDEEALRLKLAKLQVQKVSCYSEFLDPLR